MRVAVAGATGFIGAAACRALARAGHDVLPLPRSGFDGIRAEALVWAAGRREPDLEANLAVHATAPAAAARALGVRRSVYLSSGECYGSAPVPFREDGPVLATSAYARAKLAGERALAAVTVSTALRVGVGYGPGQAPRMLIPQLVAALRTGRRFGLTHGTQTRDFVFIDDIAAAIVAALAAPAIPVVNIGSGQELTVRDACEQIADALGVSRALLAFGEVPLRSDEATRYVLAVDLAREGLGWQARTTFAAGAARL